MPRGILPEVQLRAVKDYILGNGSYLSHASELGVDKTVFIRWVNKYKAFGESAFIRTRHNQAYSVSFKKYVVVVYLNGEGSYRELAVTYNIPSENTIRQWGLKFNGHEKLKASGTGGNAIMTKGRKTTLDERVEIVQYCIAHNHNYAKTSEQFEISYQQARNYTIKYEKQGVEALRDRRGKRKPEVEMSELEKLRAENRILRAEKEHEQMEADFLKNLQKSKGGGAEPAEEQTHLSGDQRGT